MLIYLAFIFLAATPAQYKTLPSDKEAIEEDLPEPADSPPLPSYDEWFEERQDQRERFRLKQKSFREQRSLQRDRFIESEEARIERIRKEDERRAKRYLEEMQKREEREERLRREREREEEYRRNRYFRKKS